LNRVLFFFFFGGRERNTGIVWPKTKCKSGGGKKSLQLGEFPAHARPAHWAGWCTVNGAQTRGKTEKWGEREREGGENNSKPKKEQVLM